ncbi:MAG TPA: phosphatase PAP2 family protein [Polyangia bacterium]
MISKGMIASIPSLGAAALVAVVALAAPSYADEAVAPEKAGATAAGDTPPETAPARAEPDEPAPAQKPVPDMRPVPDPFPDPIRRNAPHFRDHEHFTIDPVVDGVLTGGGLAFSMLLTRILGTGEIQAQRPGPSSRLLSIDRVAVTQTIDPNAGGRSNWGLYGAYAYAILDPILSGTRDGGRALLVDAIMYTEAIALIQAFTGATKIGVRRPRPIDYVRCSSDNPNANANGCEDTDLALSFFSGHASTTGAIVGVASYLAFVRSGPRSLRPWLTLGIGVLTTAFVSYERVRSGEHFPTDVIMGSLAGGAIGVLVPHFHRLPHYHEQELEAPPLLIGYAPNAQGGGSVNVQMRF